MLRRLSICVVLAALVGVSATAATAAGPPFVSIDAGAGFEAVACPSAAQCTAIDLDKQAGGSVYVGRELTFNPTTPGHPSAVSIDTTGHRFGELACASLTQCTAVDTGGSEITFDPAAPADRSEATIGTSLAGVACPSLTQCTAADEGGSVITFDPASPVAATSTKIDHEILVAIACPSAAQCTAVTQGGKVLTFDPTSVPPLGEGEEGEPGGPGAGGSGPLPALVDEGNEPTAIACASLSQCTMVDDGRDGRTKAITFDPAVPSRASTTVIESGGLSFNATAIACASSTQCVAALQTGVISAGVVVFDPQSATRPTPVTLGEDAGTGVACPSTTQCTDVIDINEVTFNPTTLGRGGAGGVAAHSWTRTQCRSAYALWSRRHRHATRAQSRAEGRELHEKHGCPSSGL